LWPELRERNYGIFQGITARELAANSPDTYARHQSRDLDYDYESGESLRVFAERVDTGLLLIARQHFGEQVLVVTHGGVLDIVYRLATGRGISEPRDFTIPNAALNWLDLVEGIWRLELWADTEHLSRISALDEVK
jgi:probable phosphoglycerate mutase